ncbi:MAG: transcriptional regulator [Spirochaetes bacterium]|nr:MAG: transcriptional regulator [Spirochaetota bacterium]
MHCHGLGSGIKRALEKWSAIEFVDDHDGCLFKATIHRKPVEELDLVDKGALKVQEKTGDAPIKASISALQVHLLGFIRSPPSIWNRSLAGSPCTPTTTRILGQTACRVASISHSFLAQHRAHNFSLIQKFNQSFVEGANAFRVYFDRLRREFERRSAKRTTVQNLKTAIELRLQRLLQQNP